MHDPVTFLQALEERRHEMDECVGLVRIELVNICP